MALLNRLLAASVAATSKDADIATFKLIQAAGYTPDIESYVSLIKSAVGEVSKRSRDTLTWSNLLVWMLIRRSH